MCCIKCGGKLSGKQEKYCSERCRTKYYSLKRYERNNYKNLKEKHCIICNEILNGQKMKFCSNKCKQKEHYRKSKKSNSYHNQTIRGLKRKIYFINKLGGKCKKCSYNKNIAALQFHHIDSTKKKFKLDLRKLSNTRMDILEEEIKKCDLLCSNCHFEKHNPELFYQDILMFLNINI